MLLPQIFRVGAIAVLICSFLALANDAEIVHLAKTTRAETLSTFLAQGQVNLTEIKTYRGLLLQRRTEIAKNIEIYFEKHQGKEAAQEELESEDYLEQMDLLISWVDDLLRANQEGATREYIEKEILKIAEVDTALQTFVQPKNSYSIKRREVKRFLKAFAIDKNNQNEAKNLVDPKTKKILSPKEIQNLKDTGFDFSLLDPPSNNGVVDLELNIENVDVEKHYQKAKGPLYSDTKVHFPEEDQVVYFDSLRKTQSKPKMNVHFLDNKGKKRKVKLKLGSEIHAEPTVAALGTALGLYHDKSLYARRIKVRLGAVGIDDLKLDWNSYFDPKLFDELIVERGQDATGNYVIFRDGVFEAKFKDKEMTRLGPWYWNLHGHQDRREMRGLAMFNVWVQSTDIKEGENNKLIYRSINDEDRLFYLQHDVGFGLGRFFKEKPLDFVWDPIKHNTSKAIQFKYRSFQDFSGFEHITFSDAKWMVRRIARLSRKQIHDAVGLGGWPNLEPYNFQALLIEKLIHRRNVLVEAFGLNGEAHESDKKISLLKVDKTIEKRVQTPPTEGLDGYTLSFRPEIRAELIDPFIEKAKAFVRDGRFKLLGALEKFSIEPEYFGFDHGDITEVLFNVNRNIVENPNPKSVNEQYIIRDDFSIGLRLGAGYVVSGDVSYMRKYSLIYTTSTLKQAQNHHLLVWKLLNPYSKVAHEFPKGHIYISESFLSGRGRLRAETGGIGPGLSLSQSRIGLTRTLVSTKTPGYLTLVNDNSLDNETALNLYTKLAVAKIHHMKVGRGFGNVERFRYDLQGYQAEALDLALIKNDFSELRKRIRPKKVSSSFIYDRMSFNALGLVKKERKKRLDQMKITQVDSKTGKFRTHYRFQAQVIKKDTWKFLKDGEEHSKNIQLSSLLDKSALRNPGISLAVEHRDRNVVQQEFFNAYLGFVDAIAGLKNFLNFTPELHNPWDSWGELSFKTEVFYNKKAIDQIINISESELIQRAFKDSNLTKQELRNYRNNYRKNDRDQSRLVVYMNGREYDAPNVMKAIVKFIKQRKKGAQSTNLMKKVNAIVEALNEALYRSNGGYNPVILSVINQTLSKKSFYMESIVRSPKDVEAPFPAKVVLFNHQGSLDSETLIATQILFDMEEALVIYKAF